MGGVCLGWSVRRLSRWGDSSVGLARGPVPAGTHVENEIYNIQESNPLIPLVGLKPGYLALSMGQRSLTLRWACYGSQGKKTRVVRGRNSGSDILKLQSVSWGNTQKLRSLFPAPRRRATRPPWCLTSAVSRSTWSDFSRPPTPNSYGEVLSVSSIVARNMPNAASDIVRPSFNPLNYHLWLPTIECRVYVAPQDFE